MSGDQFYFILEYEEGDKSDGGCLRRIRGFHQPLPGYDGCFLVDGVVNYFLARTDAVRRVGFDPFLKRVGHTGKCSKFYFSKTSSLIASLISFIHWFHYKLKLHPFFISMSHHHWLQSSLLMELESWWLPLVKAFLLVTRHIGHMTNMTFIGIKENLKRSENWLTISLRTILTTSSTDWKQSNLIIH